MVRIETPWTADLIHFQMDKRVLAKPLVRSWGGQLINWMRVSDDVSMVRTATGSTATMMALNTRHGFSSNSRDPMAPRVEAANRVGPVKITKYMYIIYIFICINLLVLVAKNKILKIRIISKSHRFIWFLFSSKQNLYLKPAAYTCKCVGWRKHIISIGQFTEFFQQISWMIDQFLLCMVTYQLGSSLALCPENQWYFYSTTYKVNLFHNHPLFMSYFIPLFHQTVPLSWCKCSVLKELVL